MLTHYLSATSIWDGANRDSVRYLAFCGEQIRYPETDAERTTVVIANYGPPTRVNCDGCLTGYADYLKSVRRA